MKTNLVLILSLVVFGTSCKKKYEEGFAAGEEQGLIDGREAGEVEGYADGLAQGEAIAYDRGFTDAEPQGFEDGYASAQEYFAYAGFDEGFRDGAPFGASDGAADGYADGYNLGYAQAYDPAYDEGLIFGGIDGDDAGRVDGYNDGYSDGYDDGYDIGYDDGYDDGFDSRYDDGYDDGYSDGYDRGYGAGNSTQSQNPVVRLALMVNQDLIDYKNLKKFDAVQVSPTLGMSDSSDVYVDMEKFAALKEAHYLNQMAQQLQAKFALSTSRSQELSKVVHQFNKLSGTRELTQADADAFAKDAIGVDLKSIDTAVRESFKGNSKMLNDLIHNIAGHNRTSTENVNSMISQIFF